MNVKEHLLQMLTHDNWANRECLFALRSASPAPPNAIRFIAHTLSAQKLWLERLRSQPQTMPVWPAATIEDCSALALSRPAFIELVHANPRILDAHYPHHPGGNADHGHFVGGGVLDR